MPQRSEKLPKRLSFNRREAIIPALCCGVAVAFCAVLAAGSVGLPLGGEAAWPSLLATGLGAGVIAGAAVWRSYPLQTSVEELWQGIGELFKRL